MAPGAPTSMEGAGQRRFDREDGECRFECGALHWCMEAAAGHGRGAETEHGHLD